LQIILIQNKSQLWFCPGFIASSKDGNATTWSWWFRLHSSTIANGVNADPLEIWTDVNGNVYCKSEN
jgi:aspartokinase